MTLIKILLFFSVFVILSVSILFYAEFAKSNNSLLIVNSNGVDALPLNFHKGSMQTSGSAQFSEDELKNMLAAIPSKKITIIDLREESHGFLNGMAISWFGGKHNWINLGKSEKEVIRDENKLLSKLKQKNIVWAFKRRRFPIPFFPKDVATEEEIAKRHNAQYLRLPATDHRRPSDFTTDKFVDFIKNHPNDVWLHFHCSAGKGRTTTFIAMFDMMKFKDLSFDEIIKKQIDMGGINLLFIPTDKDWKVPYVIERIEFLKDFYLFNQEVSNNSISWSDWIYTIKLKN